MDSTEGSVVGQNAEVELALSNKLATGDAKATLINSLLSGKASEETVPNRARRLDWIGQLCVSLALWALSYALIEAGNAGWDAPRVLAAFVAAIVLAGMCAWVAVGVLAPLVSIIQSLSGGGQ